MDRCRFVPMEVEAQIQEAETILNFYLGIFNLSKTVWSLVFILVIILLIYKLPPQKSSYLLCD